MVMVVDEVMAMVVDGHTEAGEVNITTSEEGHRHAGPTAEAGAQRWAAVAMIETEKTSTGEAVETFGSTAELGERITDLIGMTTADENGPEVAAIRVAAKILMGRADAVANEAAVVPALVR
mmetsp:Transcript_25508/g.70458  ORF Transcript_25508/g.70458 Transcript_25508/m.70458 type:complete len:121 (-) Transcript_25508:1707-2069(-)